MKRIVTLCVAVLCLLAVTLHADETAEKAAIKKAVEDYYFMGLQNSDPALLGMVFREDSYLRSINEDGTVWEMPFVEWRKFFNPENPSDTVWDRKVVSVEIAGNAASVNTKLVSEKTTYIDFLNMLKIDGKWMIVSKIFHTIHK